MSEIPEVMKTTFELAELTARIDEQTEEELTQETVERFRTAHANQTLAVDACMRLMASLKGLRFVVKGQKKQAVVDDKKFIKLERALKGAFKILIESNPGIPFRSSTGRKVYLASPSIKPLKTTFTLGRIALSSVLGEGDIQQIDKKYIRTVTVMTLDTDLVRADLERGVELSWAFLDQTKHVKGL